MVLARSLHWMDASMTDYKCSTSIQSSFDTRFGNFPIFFTVLQYWVPPSPLCEKATRSFFIHPQTPLPQSPSQPLLGSSPNAPPHQWGGALRDDPNNGFEGDYLAAALGTIFFEEVQYQYVSLHVIIFFKNRMARFGYGPNTVTVAQVDNI